MLEEPKAGPHVFQVQICDHLCVVGHDTQSHKFRILNKLMAIGIRKIHSIYIYPNIHIYISSHVQTHSGPSALLVFLFLSLVALFNPCDTFITHVRLIKKLTTIMTNISKANTLRHATRSIFPSREINI